MIVIYLYIWDWTKTSYIFYIESEAIKLTLYVFSIVGIDLFTIYVLISFIIFELNNFSHFFNIENKRNNNNNRRVFLYYYYYYYNRMRV